MISDLQARFARPTSDCKVNTIFKSRRQNLRTFWECLFVKVDGWKMLMICTHEMHESNQFSRQIDVYKFHLGHVLSLESNDDTFSKPMLAILVVFEVPSEGVRFRPL